MSPSNTDSTADSDVVIDIRDLTKDYETGFFHQRKVRALDHLSLQVGRGEVFGFLGPNGAGKTTTLKLLMGLIFATEGSALILGRSVNDIETRSRIGYLPENPYFYDYLSARELLEYTAALFGIPKERIGQRAKEMLETVGLDSERANRQLRKYSKGMLQRIGIAQALINDPEVVFLDEPMSGLDPIGRQEVRDLLLSLKKGGKTVFFSSHILSDVEALCDRVAVLSGGKLLKAGTVGEMTGAQDGALELVASGVDQPSDGDFGSGLTSLISSSHTPTGLRLVLRDDSEIENAVALIHKRGGRLVSITPRRASLEEIFAGAREKTSKN
jgi:ABC-2 type transport system ATP-binding protein